MIETLLELLEITFVGRLLLSFLPPGEVGSHRLRDLPVTIATSYLLGLVAQQAIASWAGLFDAQPNIWLVRVAWMLVLALRVLTLPGAIVPRGQVEHELGGTLTIVTWIACVVLVALGFRYEVIFEGNPNQLERPYYVARDIGENTLNVGVLCILLDHGMRTARRAPLGRALAIATALVAALTFGAADGIASVSYGMLKPIGGAVFAIAWLRRADLRALTIAAILFARTGSWSAPSCLAILTLATPRTSVRRALGTAIGAFAVVGAPEVIDSLRYEPDYSDLTLGRRLLEAWHSLLRLPLVAFVVLFVVAATCAMIQRWRRSPTERSQRVDPPGREFVALCALLAVGSVLKLFEIGDKEPLMPLVVLIAALALLPAERIEARSAA